MVGVVGEVKKKNGKEMRRDEMRLDALRDSYGCRYKSTFSVLFCAPRAERTENTP